MLVGVHWRKSSIKTADWFSPIIARAWPVVMARSEKYKFGDPEGMYFVTSTVVGWVDVFTRPELKHIVIDSLRYCQKGKWFGDPCLVP